MDASRKAGVSTKTLSALIAGRRWPTPETQRRIEQALDWPDGELRRRARGERPSLSAYTNRELLLELIARDAREC